MPLSTTQTRLAPLSVRASTRQVMTNIPYKSWSVDLTEAAWLILVASGIVGTFFLSLLWKFQDTKDSYYINLPKGLNSKTWVHRRNLVEKHHTGAGKLGCSWRSAHPLRQSASLSLDCAAGCWWFWCQSAVFLIWSKVILVFWGTGEHTAVTSLKPLMWKTFQREFIKTLILCFNQLLHKKYNLWHGLLMSSHHWNSEHRTRYSIIKSTSFSQNKSYEFCCKEIDPRKLFFHFYDPNSHFYSVSVRFKFLFHFCLIQFPMKLTQQA